MAESMRRNIDHLAQEPYKRSLDWYR